MKPRNIKYQGESVKQISEGGTGFSYYTLGDMLYANGANSLGRLGIGSEGYKLTVENGLPTWKAAGDLPDTGLKGDILYWDGSAWTKLNISTATYFLNISSNGIPQWFNLFGTANTWSAIQTLSAGAYMGDYSGGNYTEIKSDGEINLNGTAKVKITRSFTFNYSQAIGTGKPTLVNRGVFFGFSLPVYNSDDEELFTCHCVIPEWDGTTDPVIYVGGWLDTANTGKKFNLQVSVEKCDMAANEVVPATTNDYEVETDTGTAAQYTSFKIGFTIDASAVGFEYGDTIAIRVRRLAATSDEIAGEFVVEGVAIEYTANKLGEAT